MSSYACVPNYCARKVDMDLIDVAHQTKAGSALAGSSEILVEHLKETEFEIVFLDYESDSDFRLLVVDEVNGVSSTTSVDALTKLEGRC